MEDNNILKDIKSNNLETSENSKNINFISFSEVDKSGVFREAYGYFENLDFMDKENENKENEGTIFLVKIPLSYIAQS